MLLAFDTINRQMVSADEVAKNNIDEPFRYWMSSFSSMDTLVNLRIFLNYNHSDRICLCDMV